MSSDDTLFHAPLSSQHELEGWIMEGPGRASFPQGQLRLESGGQLEDGQGANFVYWCPLVFPDHISIGFEFRPLYEPGLAMFFFAARGRASKDLFDSTLEQRNGPYRQYHHGDIDTLHLSYFRRRQPDERRFHTCNLRKSHGFHLVALGADPIPEAREADGFYQLKIHKAGPKVDFFIDGLPVLSWEDDATHGPILIEGRIGFRQMHPLIAEHRNLTISTLSKTL